MITRIKFLMVAIISILSLASIRFKSSQMVMAESIFDYKILVLIIIMMISTNPIFSQSILTDDGHKHWEGSFVAGLNNEAINLILVLHISKCNSLESRCSWELPRKLRSLEIGEKMSWKHIITMQRDSNSHLQSC